MKRKLPPVPWLVATVLLYGVLSVLCFATASSPALQSSIGRFSRLLWLFGPPALLIHGSGYAVLYAACTLVVAGLLLAGAWCCRRSSDFYILFFLLAIAAWCGSGFITYAPGM